MEILSNYIIPRKINEFELRVFQTPEFSRYCYSTDGSFLTPNPFNQSDLETENFKEYIKNFSEKVKYEVEAPNEIVHLKIKEKLFLNEQIDTLFESSMVKSQYDTTQILNLGNSVFVSKLFEVYEHIDSISNSLFYIVVSIFPKRDAPFILEFLNGLSKTHKENGLEFYFDSPDCNSKEIQFSSKIHLLSFSADNDREELEKYFIKNGWRINLINERYIINHRQKKEKFQNQIILCEGTDKRLLDSLKIPNIVFSNEHNSYTIFQNAKTNIRRCLRDKDYLTIDEVKKIKTKFPNYYILNYYCLENYLYHPDNIKDLLKEDFNKEEYIKYITQQKEITLNEIIPTISKARGNYAELKENHINPTENGNEQVIAELESNDFNTFYKHLNMKNLKREYLNRYHLTRMKLASTSWFKHNLLWILNIK